MVDLYKNDRSNSYNLTYKIVVAKIIIIYVVLELLKVKNLNFTWYGISYLIMTWTHMVLVFL